MYKLTGADVFRRKLAEKIKRIPVDNFDVSKMDPEYLRILRLAEMKGHKVIFLTSNPKHIADKWAERIRIMFPRLNMEVRTVPTMGEKIQIVENEARQRGEDVVHFFDDSLPGAGGRYNLWRVKYDKARLLKEYELELKNRKELERKTFESMRNAWSKHIEGK